MSARFPASKLPIAATPHYVNGEYVASPTGEELAVVDAATEEVIWVCREATPLLVDDAFRAARNAFGLWSTTTGAMRATVLRAIATGVKEHHEALSRLECHMGKILSEARWDVDDVVACFEYYAERAEAEDARGKRAVELPDEEYVCEVRREPIGVVAAITPWNYPLLMATWKLAPALAAGCTVVLKPSELAPLSSVTLGAICARAGLPRGVLNILVGGGAVGAAMAAHAEADKVSFTGSEASGIKVSLAAAPTVKNVSLELGGKSAILVFDDGVDLDHAVEWVMFGCFWTNGQICSATSRLLVQDSLYERFVSRLVECARAIPLVAPLEQGAEEATGALGPLVARRMHDKVCRLVREAIADGAQCLTGGRPPPSRARGYFYEPTVLRVEPTKHAIWHTEVFGPVLSVATFSSEAEAIALANGTQYGLAAAVLSAQTARRERVASAMRAGIVWVSCSQPAFCQAPWGGYKRSGVGRDLGERGLEPYQETKQLTTYVGTGPLGWYTLPTRSKL